MVTKIDKNNFESPMETEGLLCFRVEDEGLGFRSARQKSERYAGEKVKGRGLRIKGF